MAALQLTLDDFMAEHAARPQVWGEVDCCLVLADWAMRLGFADPAPDLRGAYADEDACKAIVRQAGGLAPLVERCCARIGWERTEQVEPGVIGVIGSPSIVNRQWGAIRAGDRWAVRMENGFVAFHARAFAMWRPSCL